jgi:hypothetical protein
MQQNKFIKNIFEVGEYSSDSNILLKTFENIIGQVPSHKGQLMAK